MFKVSHKIKLTVIAEDFAVEVDGCRRTYQQSTTVFKSTGVQKRKMGQAVFSHRCTHVVIQSSQCASFPRSSHLQDYCHVFTIKVSVSFLYARHVLSRSNCLCVGHRADLSRQWGVRTNPPNPPAHGPVYLLLPLTSV